MGKIRSLDVRFDNRARIYHAGEHLNGQVLVDLREPSYIQRIEVDVYSKPCIRYSSGTGCCTTVFSEAEPLGERVTIFPSSSSLEDEAGVSLRAGSHSFSFNVPLPANIPSSFECKYSKVQYYVIAEVELGGSRSAREKTKAMFKVINSVDLLMFPHTQLSQQRHARVNISPTPIPALSQTGPLEVRFHINKGGYIPGEKVKIYGEITNNTALQVRKSYVELVQEVRLHSNQRVKTVRSPVTGLRHHSIPAGESDIWDTDCLTIPDLPPSTLNQNSANMSITYLLQLVVVPGGLSQKIKLPIEITVGTGLGLPSMRAPPMVDTFRDHDQICMDLEPSSRRSVTLPQDPSDQFLDIINQAGGRVTLHVHSPPPYSPYDEAPPTYQEALNSDS